MTSLHMRQHQDSMLTTSVIFELLANVVSCENNVYVQKALLNAGRNILLVRAFFTEFYVYFVLCNRRIPTNQPCHDALNCIRLRLHGVFDVLKQKSVPAESITPRPSCMLSCTCHGSHSEGHINASYYKAVHDLGHAFFTQSMCKLVIEKMTHAVEVFIPPEHEELLLTSGKREMIPVFTPIRVRQRLDAGSEDTRDRAHVTACNLNDDFLTFCHQNQNQATNGSFTPIKAREGPIQPPLSDNDDKLLSQQSTGVAASHNVSHRLNFSTNGERCSTKENRSFSPDPILDPRSQ